MSQGDVGDLATRSAEERQKLGSQYADEVQNLRDQVIQAYNMRSLKQNQSQTELVAKFYVH